MNRLMRIAVLASLAATSAPAFAAAPAWQLQTGTLSRASAQALSMAALRVGAIDLAAGPALADADELEFRLFDRSMVAHRTSVERTADGWTWNGQIDGEPGHFVVLSASGDHYAGLVSTHQGNFEIRPHRAGTAHLIELDGSAFPACGGAVEPPAVDVEVPSLAPTEAIVEPAGAPLVTVDVMVMYTPTLLTALGGVSQVRAQATAAVAAANTAFTNSQMTTRLNLVATLQNPFDEGAAGSNISSAQLSTFRNNAEVQTLRNTHGADLVALMVNDGSSNCGIGYVMRTVGSAFASSGYQITASSCAVGNLSYAHEHGHNMGMEHDGPNGTAPASASYPWSFGYTVNGSYRTVMAYSTACTGGCPRRAYFSNPAVIYNGVATGVAETADNHRTGNATGPISAAFRVSNLIMRSGFDSTP